MYVLSLFQFTHVRIIGRELLTYAINRVILNEEKAIHLRRGEIGKTKKM